MTGWDHEFAVPFIHEGHFRVTDPGPLRAPVLDFSLRRDEALDLMQQMPGKELTLSIPRSDKETGETKINAEEWPSISRTFGQTKRASDTA